MTEPYLVVMTWDNWPEGGSYTTDVQATSHDDAIQQVLRQMAESRAEEQELCPHCGQDTDDGEGYNGFCGDCADRIENGEELEDTDAGQAIILAQYGDQWHVASCFPMRASNNDAAAVHGGGDPDGNNKDRCERGRSVATFYTDLTGVDAEDVLGDVIADLLHFAHERADDLPEVIAKAVNTFNGDTEKTVPSKAAA